MEPAEGCGSKTWSLPCGEERFLEELEVDTFERVKKVICDNQNLEGDEVTPEAAFMEDLGADSLDMVELSMALEEEFQIEIPDEDAEKIRKVGDAVRYIDERLKG